MNEARQYTQEEVRKMVLEHIHHLIRYWRDEARTPDVGDKLHGLAFSICTMIDGCSMGLPAFALIPMPHPDDMEYCQEEGENWFPQIPKEHRELINKLDIVGYGLHEAL